MATVRKSLIILSMALLTACAGTGTKPEPSNTKDKTSNSASSKGGGYYLDDGPGDTTGIDFDSIPDAQLKTEKPLVSSNKPYQALGQRYVPMTSYVPYSKQGVASWYGKRYHGRKTSSGEVYDMFGMSAAHTTLPIPSFARVTNPANGKTVIVRVNDRGPFKNDRLIDLSYAAAHKLGLVANGSGTVEVTAIDTSPEALKKLTNTTVAKAELVNTNPTQSTEPISVINTGKPLVSETATNNEVRTSSYYVQAGAFKSEANGELLQKKILDLDLAGDAAVTSVYNSGLHRVRIGPFANKKEADLHANKLRNQLNISAIVTNQ